MGRNLEPDHLLFLGSNASTSASSQPKAPTYSAGCFQGELVWPERDKGEGCVAGDLSLNTPLTVPITGAVA